MSIEELSQKNQNPNISPQASAEQNERINRLEIIEQEVAKEIEELKEKKERFREWTKSIGDNERIKELFNAFDADFSRVTDKLSNLKKFKELLSIPPGEAGTAEGRPNASAEEAFQALLDINKIDPEDALAIQMAIGDAVRKAENFQNAIDAESSRAAVQSDETPESHSCESDIIYLRRLGILRKTAEAVKPRKNSGRSRAKQKPR